MPAPELDNHWYCASNDNRSVLVASQSVQTSHGPHRLRQLDSHPRMRCPPCRSCLQVKLHAPYVTNGRAVTVARTVPTLLQIPSRTLFTGLGAPVAGPRACPAATPCPGLAITCTPHICHHWSCSRFLWGSHRHRGRTSRKGTPGCLTRQTRCSHTCPGAHWSSRCH